MPDFFNDFPQTEVDRVIDGSEVKTVNLYGTLAFLNSPNLDFSTTSIYLDNPVPVLGLDDTQVGHANISLKTTGSQSLVANVFLRYDSQERLLLDNGESLYLRVNGRMHVAEAVHKGAIDLYSNKSTVLAIYVDNLSLQRTAPSDSRIAALGKEVL